MTQYHSTVSVSEFSTLDSPGSPTFFFLFFRRLFFLLAFLPMGVVVSSTNGAGVVPPIGVIFNGNAPAPNISGGT